MRLIIYTGKGGTGKTVSACSTALKLSSLKSRTLLVSADPAHTLGDALMMGGEIGGTPTSISTDLYAAQVDPVAEMDSHFKTIFSYFASYFQAKGIDDTISYELAMLPGMTQLLCLLKIEEAVRSGEYDVIILDMPASGEALRFLYFPKLVGSLSMRLSGLAGLVSGFGRIFQPYFSGPALSSDLMKTEADLLHKLEELSKLIFDPNVTSLRLVANADSFSMENAKRTLMSANLYGINVDLIIINKIMPQIRSKDSFLANWVALQHARVTEAKSNFYPLPVKEVPLYNEELRGIEMLKQNAEILFGDQDPSQVFYRERVFEFKSDGSGLTLKLKVPFTRNADFLVERISDRITIKVATKIGYVVNVIPLPAITLGMKLKAAQLSDKELVISFEY
ncbi:MAG TPA: TRC40/GET3/ArsA family transport-energizing ATPase [Nitrososphaeraceae archaeon]|nr:TRC40/GET3/ArsA family transport-energizing ATPase [Nitrososphaeraceae archaeon]